MRRKVLSIAVIASLIMNSMPVKAVDSLFENEPVRRAQVVVSAPVALEDLEINKSKKIAVAPVAAAPEKNAFDEKVSGVARMGAKFVLERIADAVSVAAGGFVGYIAGSPEFGKKAGVAVRGVISMTKVTDKIADFVAEKAPGAVRAVANAAVNVGKRFTNWLFGRNQSSVVATAPAA
jgi:hypothetical protein